MADYNPLYQYKESHYNINSTSANNAGAALTPDVILSEDGLEHLIKLIRYNDKENYHFISTLNMRQKMTINQVFPHGFNQYELEIATVFPMTDNNVRWDKNYIKKICIINNEFPKHVENNDDGANDTNRNSGRYTWVQSGNDLDFENELSLQLIESPINDNRPIGTFLINEDDGLEQHVVEIKGFSDGNFTNTAIDAYIQVTNGYIDNLETKNLKVLGDNGISTDGTFIVNNTEEAYRYATTVSNINYTPLTKIGNNYSATATPNIVLASTTAATNETVYNVLTANAQVLDENDKPHENEWYFEKYESTTVDSNFLTNISAKTPVTTTYYKDANIKTSMNIANTYTAKCTTYLYCNSPTTISVKFITDDNGLVLLNDTTITSVTSTKWTSAQSLTLQPGENKLVIYYTEGTGSDGWQTDPLLSSDTIKNQGITMLGAQRGYKQYKLCIKTNNNDYYYAETNQKFPSSTQFLIETQTVAGDITTDNISLNNLLTASNNYNTQFLEATSLDYLPAYKYLGYWKLLSNSSTYSINTNYYIQTDTIFSTYNDSFNEEQPVSWNQTITNGLYISNQSTPNLNNKNDFIQIENKREFNSSQIYYLLNLMQYIYSSATWYQNIAVIYTFNPSTRILSKVLQDPFYIYGDNCYTSYTYNASTWNTDLVDGLYQKNDDFYYKIPLDANYDNSIDYKKQNIELCRQTQFTQKRDAGQLYYKSNDNWIQATSSDTWVNNKYYIIDMIEFSYDPTKLDAAIEDGLFVLENNISYRQISKTNDNTQSDYYLPFQGQPGTTYYGFTGQEYDNSNGEDMWRLYLNQNIIFITNDNGNNYLLLSDTADYNPTQQYYEKAQNSYAYEDYALSNQKYYKPYFNTWEGANSPSNLYIMDNIYYSLSSSSLSEKVCELNETYDGNLYFFEKTINENGDENTLEPAPGLGFNDASVYGSITTLGGIAARKSIKGYKVHGAVFNDYAEYRHTKEIQPGRCVIETGNGDLVLSTQRMQLGANIISDTYGFSIGETSHANTPIAVCGRVLAYPNEPREFFKPGQAVCSGPNGTVSRMHREEIRNWPDAIVGTVSEIPKYETWGSDNIKVDGRIWIKVK